MRNWLKKRSKSNKLTPDALHGVRKKPDVIDSYHFYLSAIIIGLLMGPGMFGEGVVDYLEQFDLSGFHLGVILAD